MFAQEAGERASRAAARLPGAARAPPATVSTTSAGIVDRRKFHEPDAVGKLLEQIRGDLQRQARLARCRPCPVSVSSRVLPSSRFTSAISRSRPMKLVSCTGRLFGTLSSERSAGKLRRQIAARRAGRDAPAARDRAAGARRDARSCTPVGRRSRTSSSRRQREQHLPAMRRGKDARSRD